MNNNRSRSGLTGVLLCVLALIVLTKISKLLGFLFSLLLGLALLAVLAFCVYIAFTAIRDSANQPSDTKNGRPLTASESKLLSEGRAALTSIRMDNLKITDPQVREKIDSVCSRMDQILSNLKRNPQRIGDSVQLLKYYLPQLAEIVDKYARLQNPGQEDSSKETMLVHLDMISEALVKQFDETLSAEKLDLTAEMEAMKAALQMDGLQTEAVITQADELAKKYENMDDHAE
ncbi:MAG: 5-bromo-4-chloroindolyl phosphate hydrolysis family protein [Firmicutes bacterium]|nr:5-bromo-4-chloroindolyl phosphate hydrolysis family protein [Bacillota bacterium]